MTKVMGRVVRHGGIIDDDSDVSSHSDLKHEESDSSAGGADDELKTATESRVKGAFSKDQNAGPIRFKVMSERRRGFKRQQSNSDQSTDGSFDAKDKAKRIKDTMDMSEMDGEQQSSDSRHLGIVTSLTPRDDLGRDLLSAEPVHVHMQTGKRLTSSSGSTFSKFEPSLTVTWDFEKEEVILLIYLTDFCRIS
ncbi:unnamed protein product [Soboliphyme baturini]|uniref:PEST proteolytic signal-containing nuclear protein n=1 Tax=Soboliphyme baturini TaxID=241478 RepID=A0A183J910_9BILA|nr:unnamed protein product [Soboliphyme baturini]